MFSARDLNMPKWKSINNWVIMCSYASEWGRNKGAFIEVEFIFGKIQADIMEAGP